MRPRSDDDDPDANPKIDVYLEAGAKRTFAGALDRPGWRSTGHGAGG